MDGRGAWGDVSDLPDGAAVRGVEVEEGEAMKRCEHCHRHGGRIGSNRLCEDCKARGWRWCVIGRHVVPAADYARRRKSCHCCWRIDTQRRWHTVRGRAASPPPGYVRLVDAAPTLGYSAVHLRGLLAAGRIDGWQRAPGGAWYIRMEATE